MILKKLQYFQQYCWIKWILLNYQQNCQQYFQQYYWNSNIVDNIADFPAILLTILLIFQQYCWFSNCAGNIVSNLADYSAILLTIFPSILNQVLPLAKGKNYHSVRARKLILGQNVSPMSTSKIQNYLEITQLHQIFWVCKVGVSNWYYPRRWFFYRYIKFWIK